MWSGICGFALEQSDFRIHECSVYPGWVEGWGIFYIHQCRKKQTFNWHKYNGSTQTCPHTFKRTLHFSHNALSK